VLAENSGFGARAAAPIARQVLDFYLLGKEPSRPALPAAGEDLPDADEMQESETLRAVNQGGEARQDAPAPAATADPGSAP